MFRQWMMAATMMTATPVLALDMPASKTADTDAVQTDPYTRAPDQKVAGPAGPKVKPPAAVAPTQGEPVATVLPATPVKTADGAPQAPARQVNAIVDREFPAYDGNGSGTLDKIEFAAWMAALKAASPEPGETPTRPWTAAAFKQADVDASDSITPDELAAFFNGAKTHAVGG
jgi:hypothetical protein